MNNTRRKQIKEIHDSIEQFCRDLEDLSIEERECYDNLPEGIQDSERGQLLEAHADAIEYAYGDLEEVRDALFNIIEGNL